MKSPTLRLSAAASAALFSALLFIPPRSALASLATPPESSALEALPPPAPPAPPSVPTAPAPAAPARKTAPPKPDPAPRAAAGRDDILNLARRGMLDSAAALCKQALAADPDNAFLLLMMGKLTQDGKESAEYFKKASKLGGATPEAEESLFRLGQFHYAAGKYYLAIPCFRDYLNRFPAGDWKQPAHYWMGNACLSLAQGRPDKAAYFDSGAVWFQRMVDQSKPDEYYYPLALEGLAKVKAAKGDRGGAWQAARMAMDKAPEEEQGPLLLLAAQLRQGVDRAEEKNLMSRLLNRYPQSPEARYLRKLNAGVDTARWKSGSGLPRPVPQIPKDSLGIAAAPGDANPEPKAPVTPVLPAPAGSGEKGYTLQLGAFSQAANAQAMMAGLAKAGFAPEQVESSHGGKRIFQVRLGRFPNAEAAAEYARINLKPRKFLSQPVPLSN